VSSFIEAQASGKGLMSFFHVSTILVSAICQRKLESSPPAAEGFTLSSSGFRVPLQSGNKNQGRH
jgi:hypothetical protein